MRQENDDYVILDRKEMKYLCEIMRKQWEDVSYEKWKKRQEKKEKEKNNREG